MNHDTKCQPFLWDSLFSWLKAAATKHRIPMITSMVVGFLAYAFAFTNKLINHDEAFSLFIKGGTAVLGRWFLGLSDSIFPNVSMPWIYGVITIFFVAVSICLIIDMLDIRSKVLQALLSGCIMAFPTLLSILSYMFTASSYGLAFFLAVLAVWLVNRWNKWAFLAAIGCMVISLATYQAFIAIAASVLLVLLIQKLLKNEELSSVIAKGVVSLGFLVLSLGLYYLSVMVVNRVLGIGFSEYANSKIEFSLLDLPAKALLAYSGFWASLAKHEFGLIPTDFSQILHFGCLAVYACLLLIWVLNQKIKEWGRYLLLLILILLLPLAINCMYLFTSLDSIHTLVLYSFVSVYILAAVLADLQLTQENRGKAKACLSTLCVHLLPLLLALVIMVNVYVSNIAFLNLHLCYEIAYSFYTSLIADIQMMPEFQEGSKLAVVGYYNGPEYYYTSFKAINNIMGVRGFQPSEYSKDRFLQYYLNFNVPLASEEEIAQIQQTAEFQEMPLYPYYGSMKWFGDTLVVRLQ